MKRYDWSQGGMDEDETGKFVRFEDAQSEIARLRDRVAELEDALRVAVGDCDFPEIWYLGAKLALECKA